MQYIYMKKEYFNDEYNYCKLFWYFKKIIYIIKCFLVKIKFEKYDANRIICTLSYKNEIRNKKLKKIIKKIKKRTKEKEIAIILSIELDKYAEFKKVLSENKYILLNGRWLLENLVVNIIEYIAEKQEKKLEEYNLSILAKNATKQNKEQIVELARKS